MDGNKLLTRTEFKTEAFKRDNHKCVFCDKPAIDPHHILDRKLFKNGGYYLNNVASVCSEHHLDCEYTRLTLPEVYKAAGISNPKLPDGFEEGKNYDKWGNIIVNEFKRIPGPLFNDYGVQKIFREQGLLWTFF